MDEKLCIFAFLCLVDIRGNFRVIHQHPDAKQESQNSAFLHHQDIAKHEECSSMGFNCGQLQSTNYCFVLLLSLEIKSLAEKIENLLLVLSLESFQSHRRQVVLLPT